jgi:hypothetical protein
MFLSLKLPEKNLFSTDAPFWENFFFSEPFRKKVTVVLAVLNFKKGESLILMHHEIYCHLLLNKKQLNIQILA